MILAALPGIRPATPCSPVQPTIWAKDPRSSSALFRVVVNGRAGYIDEKGRVVIAPRFDPFFMQLRQGDFPEGVALVLDDSHLLFIDEHGRKLNFDHFRLQEGFSDSVTIATENKAANSRAKLLVVNHSGQIVTTADQSSVFRFSEGLAAFMENKGWGAARNQFSGPFGHRRGYMDKHGKIVIPARFAYAAPFSEGLAAVAADGECWVPGPMLQHFPAPSAPVQLTSCGPYAAAAVTRSCRHGYIDKTGQIRIPDRYDLAQDFSEQRAGVQLGGTWGFIDQGGNQITEFGFDQVKPFSEDRAAVRVGSKWGYIDRTGTRTIDAQFDDALPFSGGIAAVKDGRGYFFINTVGAEVIRGRYMAATQFVKGLAHVKIGESTWAWIDSAGKAVFTYEWKQ